MVKKTGELKVAGVVNQHLLRNNNLTAGKYIVEFNGSSLSSGVYFYRLQVEGGNAYTSVKKMVLLK